MSGHKYVVEKVLAPIGIHINGSDPWDMRVRGNQLWQIVLTKYGTPQPACR